MRLLRIGAVTLITLSSLTATAIAGGSWLEPYKERYQAGETVTMRGDVSPGQLGWVEDGPFHAYLRLDLDPEGGCFNCRRDGDVYLGELDVEEISSGWLHVSITFTLPDDLRDGEYWVVYCNDSCTEGLGDLIGGLVRVAAPRPPVRWYSGSVFPV